MKRTKSQLAFETAKKLLPGGVNSPVRAFGSVEGTPPFIAKAAGAKLGQKVMLNVFNKPLE